MLDQLLLEIYVHLVAQFQIVINVVALLLVLTAQMDTFSILLTVYKIVKFLFKIENLVNYL